jgi:Domain of Unknown Function (DUF1543)
MHLYAFYLGGKAIGQNGIAANIEVHDVVFAVGETVEDCYDQCRQQWFGSPDGLHIDAHVKLESVNGYEIKPTFEKVKKTDYGDNNCLYFVYLGAPAQRFLFEEHRIVFMVANSLEEVKIRAKSNYLLNDSHIDNIIEIPTVNGCSIRLLETGIPLQHIIEAYASYIKL